MGMKTESQIAAVLHDLRLRFGETKAGERAEVRERIASIKPPKGTEYAVTLAMAGLILAWVLEEKDGSGKANPVTDLLDRIQELKWPPQ